MIKRGRKPVLKNVVWKNVGKERKATVRHYTLLHAVMKIVKN
jgi:hypothetical protein